MKCKDCEHWSENRLNHYEKDKAVHGDCDNASFTESGSEDRFKDGLEYWDYEGYSAGFTTGPDFGCIHFSSTRRGME